MQPHDHLSPAERAAFWESEAEHEDLMAQAAGREALIENGVLDTDDPFEFDYGPPISASSMRLADFAVAVAARLPGGTWRAEHHTYEQYADQFDHTEQVWDLGLTDWAVSEFVLARAATLHGPGGRLYVINRPLRPDQFLVAPLEPDGYRPHHFRHVSEPNGIAVPDDPPRAAAALARRLLPRYHLALAALKQAALARRLLPRYHLALAALKQAALAEPEPPHRPHAAETGRNFALVWYADGAVGAPESAVPSEAHDVLYACHFQYRPHEAAFLLPAAYSGTERAVLLQAAVEQLTARGFGVDFRPAAATPTRHAPQPAPAPAPTPTSQPAPSRSR